MEKEALQGAGVQLKYKLRNPPPPWRGGGVGRGFVGEVFLRRSKRRQTDQKTDIPTDRHTDRQTNIMVRLMYVQQQYITLFLILYWRQEVEGVHWTKGSFLWGTTCLRFLRFSIKNNVVDKIKLIGQSMKNTNCVGNMIENRII